MSILLKAIMKYLSNEAVIINVISAMGLPHAQVDPEKSVLHLRVLYPEIPSIERFIELDHVDYEEDLGVIKLSEEATAFKFTSKTEYFTFSLKNLDTEYVYRRISNFLANGHDPRSLPAKELVDKLNDISEKWLESEGVHIQLELKDIYHSLWGCKLVHDSGTVIAEHLNPNLADGHTYRMFICGIKDAFNRGKIQGQLDTIEHDSFDRLARVVSGITEANVRIRELRNSLHKKSIFKKDVI